MRYTIQKGDTLSALAKRFRTTVDALAKRNGIKDINRIYAGDALDLPDATAAITPAPTQPRWGAPDAGSTGVAPIRSISAAPAIKPYKSAYADRIEAILKSMEERPDFTYDYSDDPLYHNYKDSYTQGGRLAMLDTMGDAAALTGGYGSSYGQSVGQQTYQGYMTALADQVPTLAAAAYDKYRQEGDAMLDTLNGYNALEQADYARYRDEVEDAAAERELAYRQYRDERDDELERYLAELDARQKQQELAYKEAQAALSRQDKKEAAAKPKKSGAASASSDEGDKIYALFSTMTAREAASMLLDRPSVAYIQSVLGEDGYEELKRLYGAKN
ncbi:MAG: LysM peptidoglycan-binding domain-containing protein [Clostridia bacterium]|nr:LysM peptidoglycan-binding domain-containing protein [Clostridia bacterium]